jgi:glycosyltransferase involved in cell wall biosynthesis
LAQEGRQVRYLHVGAGPESAAEAVLAAELGVLERIVFVGAMDSPRAALIAGDAFAMPSEYEGLGIAALEAAVCGLPLVVYDSPGLREVVERGGCGLLARDVQSLADALGRLEDDDELRRALGTRGRESVLARFGRRAWIDAHLAVYGALNGERDQDA